MTWKTQILTENNIIEITYSNIVSRDELQAAFNVAVNLASATHLTRVLADCTQLQGGHSLMDLYQIGARLENEQLRLIKEAILLPPNGEIRQLVKFFETLCLNRGFNVKIFENRQNAITWLIA